MYKKCVGMFVACILYQTKCLYFNIFYLPQLMSSLPAHDIILVVVVVRLVVGISSLQWCWIENYINTYSGVLTKPQILLNGLSRWIYLSHEIFGFNLNWNAIKQFIIHTRFIFFIVQFLFFYYTIGLLFFIQWDFIILHNSYNKEKFVIFIFYIFFFLLRVKRLHLFYWTNYMKQKNIIWNECEGKFYVSWEMFRSFFEIFFKDSFFFW